MERIQIIATEGDQPNNAVVEVSEKTQTVKKRLTLGQLQGTINDLTVKIAQYQQELSDAQTLYNQLLQQFTDVGVSDVLGTLDKSTVDALAVKNTDAQKAALQDEIAKATDDLSKIDAAKP